MTSKRRGHQSRTPFGIATICIAAMAMVVVSLFASFAEAQERVQRRNLFQMLFGGLTRERPVYEDRDYFPEQPRPKRQRQQQQQRQKGQGQQKPKPKIADTPAPAPDSVTPIPA